MHHRVVDASAAEGNLPQHPLLYSPVVGEQIEGEGLWPSGNDADCLVQRVIRKNRQQRPENFLLHHRRIEGHAVQHRRFDPEGPAVETAPKEGVLIPHQAEQTLKMLFIDDAGIIRIAQRRHAPQPFQLDPHRFQQSVQNLPVGQHIVRRNTGLPTV